MTSVAFPFNRVWSCAEAAHLACVLEAAAPKAGNVHPSARFHDMEFAHFAVSAMGLARVFCDPTLATVGDLVIEAVQQTRVQVGCNTNLGTILLLAPLKLAVEALRQETTSDPKSQPLGIPAWCAELQRRVQTVLQQLTSQDAARVYQAINVAQAGGMGRTAKHDLRETPPEDLLEAMREVSDMDAVARQYVSGYADLWQRLMPELNEHLSVQASVSEAICHLQLSCLAWECDGLIVRKSGLAVAGRVQELARAAAGRPLDSQEYRKLDGYLRADGNRRNPGTTADLIATTLFVRLIQPLQ